MAPADPPSRAGRAAQRRRVTELAPQTPVDQVFLATHKQLRPNRNGQL